MVSLQVTKKNSIHFILTIFLCFFFRFLPPFGQMTEYGMGILGAFLGAIYGWSFLGMIWPSFMALSGVGLVIGMDKMLAAAFGNYTVMGMLFMFLMTAVMDEVGAMDMLVNKILGAKFMYGKPWILLGVIYFAAFIGGMFNAMVMTIVFIQLFISIFQKVGIAPYSKLATTMLIGVPIAMMMAQIAFPFIGQGLSLTSTYTMMFQQQMNYASYMLFIIPMGLFILFFYVNVIMRFVFRVDVSPLKNVDASMLGDGAKANRDQIVSLVFFAVFMCIMLIASLSFFGPLQQFLAQFGMFGVVAIIVGIMMMIKREDGTPLLNFYKAAAKIGWDPVLLLAFIMVMAYYMNDPSTGITTTMMSWLTPFTKLSPMIFIVVALLFAAIITNIANNLITVVMIMPVLGQFALQAGMDTTYIMAILFMCAHFALATPAANPSTGIVFSYTNWVKAGSLSKYGIITVIILFIVEIVIGIPFANLVF